jgi:uncharacterized protein
LGAASGATFSPGSFGRELEFEWDKEKTISNIKERAVDFRDAALIFEGPLIMKEDTRENYGE